MTAEARARGSWLVFGVVILAISAGGLLRFFTQRSDIWWTPPPLAVPLAQSADRVQIYVQGRLLQEQLAAQRVQVLTTRGTTTLRPADVALRFNNRDRVRAAQIPLLLGAAFIIGVVGVFVALVILGLWPPTRGPREGQA